MKFKRRQQSKAQSVKTRFRRSARWTKFRRHIKANQKFDPITGSKLSPTCSVHHLDLREENYQNIDDHERFVCLNAQTHETVHFLHAAHCGWRKAVLALISILKKMDRYSSD